jgi:hypothetical protein
LLGGLSHPAAARSSRTRSTACADVRFPGDYPPSPLLPLQADDNIRIITPVRSRSTHLARILANPDFASTHPQMRSTPAHPSDLKPYQCNARYDGVIRCRLRELQSTWALEHWRSWDLPEISGAPQRISWTSSRVAASGSDASPTALITHPISAPASITGPMLEALIPPIAAIGLSILPRISHSVSSPADTVTSLVSVPYMAPTAT